ncbi:Phox/Bem1p [Cynara cardunculus var. scolymus]|uniref:Phox/Bem1p n=2 Tax=Cynara cardunculus var. scolymus TaxID=59895 RepID=A0A118JWX5_CYNCS|nr:Phox/Bem1p [Cynara cardunculus var. scolymus]
MEQTPTPPPPSLSATAATVATTTTTATYPDSLDSSPRSRNTDSWGEDNSLYPSNNGTTTALPQLGLTKLRLMCSYGGHIVPRPHDKSLCYVGGDTRIVVVDRHTTLSDLTLRLSKILFRSSSSSSLTSTTASVFTLKYQLPSEDLDSLISVTTDEDLENMIDEYERLNSSSDVNKSSRLRLFLFPTKPESVSSIGSLLENSTKSEDWFLNALNGTTSGFSDTSSVNCLLGLDDDASVPEKKDLDHKGVIGKNPKGNNSAQDVRSVPDLERTSSFGSASSSPSLASLPPIRVHVDDNQKVGGIEEQFSQMSVRPQHHKHQDDGGYVAAPAPVVVTGVPMNSPKRVLSEDERSEQGSQIAYQKHQQQQYQQKQSMGFDLASSDSVSSDGRQKPPMIYQDQLVQIQSSNNNNRTTDLNNPPDQNTRIQMQQQQQQIADSAYLMSISTTQVDTQHPQLHHQQPQFIHTAVPPPQYIQHHPSGAVPMASYYQMYPSQNQHHPHHPAIDQQNFVYYMPARQAPHGYNLQMQQQQQQPQPTSYAEAPPASATTLPHNQPPPSSYTTSRTAQTPKSDLPAGVFGTTNSGGSQFVQVPSSQHQPQPQPQPQYVGYSQIHHPSQSVASSVAGGGANYGYEYADPAQRQHMYYAAQQLPPQSAAQYQTVTGESGSYLPADSSTKQQPGRTPQP